MHLSEYFAQPTQVFLRGTPANGEPSPWLEFCDLELKGSRVLVVDAQFVPSEKDGLLIELPAGKYAVQTQVTNFGGDRRISRLRVLPHGCASQFGAQIGETWTDTATTGICDFETFAKAWGTDQDGSYQIIEPFLVEGSAFGVAELEVASGAVMPFVQSGFGDGSFAVFELTENGRRTGFEVEFISSDEKYPFGVMPYQKASHLGKIRQAAEQGDSAAQFELGKLSQAGKEVEKNLETAANWYEKAARNGHAEAALKLGHFYKTGKGRARDFVRAKELFEFAASKNLISALNELGVMYRHGQGVPVDYERAVAYYQQAADKGYGHAQYNLAVHYSKGWGVPQNYEQSVRLYRLAADQGHLEAIFNLGCILKRGEPGVPKDEKESFRLFCAGAMNDHASCANNVGDCFETGCGTEKDLKKAFMWYSLAAGKEVPMAQKNLGLLYKNGEGGIKKNLALAVKHISKASENGLAAGHFELGLLYETGEGVAQDKVEAWKLYQKAVNGGFVEADAKLKELFASLSQSERTALSENSKNQT